MPTIKDITTCYGNAKITNSEGSAIAPSGNIYTLPTASETYTLTGDFSDYKIKITGKKVNLRFNGVYYKNENENDADPFIQYVVDGSRLELKLVDRKLNYIYKQAGVCISSNKNLVINDADASADLYLSCPNGCGISAVNGDVRIVNDGGRYITNCKIGIYTNLLSVGDDQEEPDYSKKKNTYLYAINNETDVKLRSRIASSTGSNTPGKIVVTPNDYGCALIGNIMNETAADQELVLLEARTDTVNPEIGTSFAKCPIAYYHETELKTKDFINYQTFNEYQIPDNVIEDATAWKVYKTVSIEEFNTLSDNFEALVKRVTALEEKSAQDQTAGAVFNETELNLSNIVSTETLDFTGKAEFIDTTLDIK